MMKDALFKALQFLWDLVCIPLALTAGFMV